ncbi:hypothetical protein QNI16_12495 [Cytophagaceae bacterium YF14B1]|uniref:Uncharacterized protein n=1 Tax=Xanthocytophaga flava TaxID=3048013 RepID=A0AAE3U8L4_9BACT|nr:hypothetical protein [Xanthocytophaga flavus]MDJ1481308.1 hypothetical protein [Xanthocytophaga flavus]
METPETKTPVTMAQLTMEQVTIAQVKSTLDAALTGFRQRQNICATAFQHIKESAEEPPTDMLSVFKKMGTLASHCVETMANRFQ